MSDMPASPTPMPKAPTDPAPISSATPAPTPAPAPATPPPAPPKPQTPAPTPRPVAPTPPISTPPAAHHSILGPIVGILVIIVIAVIIYLFKPWETLTLPSFWNTNPLATPTQPAPTPTPTPTPAAPSPVETPVPTTTEAFPYETAPNITKNIGDDLQLFEKSSITLKDPKNSQRSFIVTALEFGDSRCQKGQTCVWAGEQTVRIQVFHQQSNETKEITLGTTRASIGKIFDLTLTLKVIDEGKGGTYAEVGTK